MQKITVSFSAQDKGTGVSSITLKRYFDVTKTWSDIKTWNYSGKAWRSSNSPNQTSGSSTVILYRVVGTEKTVVYGSTTKANFSAFDTNSSFDMYYEIGADEKDSAVQIAICL